MLFRSNLGVVDCNLYANSTSGVAWLPGSASPLFARGCMSSALSTLGGKIIMEDPQTTGSAGNLVTISSSKLVLATPSGAASTSVNLLIVGCSATS